MADGENFEDDLFADLYIIPTAQLEVTRAFKTSLLTVALGTMITTRRNPALEMERRLQRLDLPIRKATT